MLSVAKYNYVDAFLGFAASDPGVDQAARVYMNLPEEAQANLQVILACMRCSTRFLDHIPLHFIRPSFFKNVLGQWWLSRYKNLVKLRFCPRLANDRNVALLAYAQNGHVMIEFVGDDITNNMQFLLELFDQTTVPAHVTFKACMLAYPRIAHFASNRQFVLKIVEVCACGSCLSHAPAFCSDTEIVRKAVRHNVNALGCVVSNFNLQANFDMLELAVQADGNAMRFVPSSLPPQQYDNLMRVALRSVLCDQVLDKVSKALLDDEEAMITAVEHNLLGLQKRFSRRPKKSRRLLLRSLCFCKSADEFFHSILKQDPGVALAKLVAP